MDGGKNGMLQESKLIVTDTKEAERVMREGSYRVGRGVSDARCIERCVKRWVDEWIKSRQGREVSQ